MMQPAVIDLLSVKGKFSTEQALVLAEAIDMTIEKAQLVTVPILDARLAVVTGRIDRTDGRIDRLEAEMKAGFAALEARMEAKMQRWAVLIVTATLLGQTALGPIGMGALDSARKALSTLVH
jgi:hypothetical protein